MSWSGRTSYSRANEQRRKEICALAMAGKKVSEIRDAVHLPYNTILRVLWKGGINPAKANCSCKGIGTSDKRAAQTRQQAAQSWTDVKFENVSTHVLANEFKIIGRQPVTRSVFSQTHGNSSLSWVA